MKAGNTEHGIERGKLNTVKVTICKRIEAYSHQNMLRPLYFELMACVTARSIAEFLENDHFPLFMRNLYTIA